MQLPIPKWIWKDKKKHVTELLLDISSQVQGKISTHSSIAQMFVNKHSFADEVWKTFQHRESDWGMATEEKLWKLAENETKANSW